MSKLIFLDIDGTIRDFSGVIPDSTVRAIRKAREAGHTVCVCTGRPYWVVEQRILDIGFDGIISGVGTYIMLGGECIEHRYFSKEVLEEICGYFEEQRCLFEMQNYYTGYILESRKDEYAQHKERLEEKLGLAKGGLKGAPVIQKQMTGEEKIEKINYFSNTLTEEVVKRRFRGMAVVVGLSGPNTHKFGCEISPAGISKKSGMKAVQRRTGYDRQDIIAVGDSENDMDMIEYAGVGVAMGNGIDKLKAAADMVTDTALNDGIEKAFKKLGLIS